MHKRAFSLSHKLNYGNMHLFVLVWREIEMPHTRTQTDQGFVVSDQEKASPSWDSVLGWTASIQTLRIVTSQAVAGKLPTKKIVKQLVFSLQRSLFSGTCSIHREHVEEDADIMYLNSLTLGADLCSEWHTSLFLRILLCFINTKWLSSSVHTDQHTVSKFPEPVCNHSPLFQTEDVLLC